MEDSLYLGELVAALFYLFAGARLIRLAAKTGEQPERLLGLLFLVTGASYFVWWIPVAAAEAWETPLAFAGRVLYLPAPVILAVFTRRVFGRGDAWATWLVYTTAVALGVGVASSALGGDWEGYSIGNPWFWPEWLGYTLPFAWAGIEALRQHARARRRLKLDLCDPLVCHRFLLWGLFGLVQVLVSVAVIAQYADYEQRGAFSNGWDLIVSALEIASIALIWLVFFPPAFYPRWIGGAERARAVSTH